MNIFLTGEIQIGKTMIIEKVIQSLNLNYGGFKTYFGPDRKLPTRLLYMNSITEPYIYNKKYGIVQISEFAKPEIIDNRFNSYGSKLIKEAIENKELIIMDELGRFEKDSLEFQEQVFRAIESKTPVLGVIKLDFQGWVDKIRNHPNVELIFVTKDNRDDLPILIKEKLEIELENKKSI